MAVRWRGSWRHWLEAGFILSFVVVLGVLFHDRSSYVNRVYGTGINCRGCFTAPMFLHDLAYFSALILLAGGSFWVRRAWLYVPMRILSLFGVLVYLADIGVTKEFRTRLSLADVRVYGTKIDLLWRHIQGIGWLNFAQILLVAVCLVWAVSFILLRPTPKPLRLNTLPVLLFPLGGILAGNVYESKPYVHDWVLVNVVNSSLSSGISVPYSDAYSDRLLASRAGQEEICQAGLAKRPNIILLLLESWSPYQSKLLSGLNDWTPGIDALATQHTYFTELHAGSFATSPGLMSILVGHEFWAPIKALRSFSTAWDLEETLPKRLRENGYFTSFLTTGNLSFSGKRKWLEHIGFDYIEGHEYPGYEGKKRRHFDAVADEYLYERSMKFIEEDLDEKRPYLLVVENVSTHHPYIHPTTEEKTAEAVFKYMDETVVAFYDQLNAAGFFEDGLLILIGDHRAMVPVTHQEFEKFGPASVSLVPSVIIGGGLPVRGEVTTPHHQSDLLPTLARFTSEEYCYRGVPRSLFSEEANEPKCLFHARGDNRSRIEAFCPEGHAVVGLNGDKTRVLRNNGIPKEQRKRMIEEINLFRIQGHRRDHAPSK